MTLLIKVILAVLLLVCLFEMPYGYYQLIRFIAFIGFGILAFDANKKGRQSEVIVYLALAILFQPLLKISLGRTLWNIVDVIVAVGLLLSIGTTNKDKTEQRQ